MQAPSDQRIVFTIDEFLNYGPGGTPLIPEIAYLGWCRTERADRGHLAPHSHRGVFEITLVLEGEVDWIGGGEFYQLRRGDVFVTLPDEVHYSRDHSLQPCSLYWLLLGDPDSGYNWPGLDADVVADIVGTLRALRSRSFKARTELNESFKMLFDIHQRPGTGAADIALNRVGARASLHSLMVNLIRSIRDDVSCHVPDVSTLERISPTIDLLRSRLGSQASVAELLQLKGAGLDRLNKEFLSSTGLSMAEFRARERIRSARDQLIGSLKPVNLIALDLGYSSSQHFATAFKQATGFTPKEYRKRHGAAEIGDQVRGAG